MFRPADEHAFNMGHTGTHPCTKRLSESRAVSTARRHKGTHHPTRQLAICSRKTTMLRLLLLLTTACRITLVQTFLTPQVTVRRTRLSRSYIQNEYDDWRSDAVPLSMPLDEDNVQHCLSLFIESDYGQQMFGCHDRARDIGITGSLTFVELAGPEVTLSLAGKFWHRRETVLGRAAMWLHACMPEIVQVSVADMEDLQDFEQVKDEITCEVIFEKDKRAPDYNGDRGTMQYQGMDPDTRGPFPGP